MPRPHDRTGCCSRIPPTAPGSVRAGVIQTGWPRSIANGSSSTAPSIASLLQAEGETTMPTHHKSAIVTGAASGMGRAMALGLSQAGFDVVAVDRDAAGLSTLPAPIKPL